MHAPLVGNTHLVAGRPERIADILKILEARGVKTRGNPDVYIRVYRQFGIEEAHELRERASLRPLGKQRYFIVAAPLLTSEAQNALLKTLEEPPADAMFFFIIPAPEVLLPTLRSRAQMLTLDSEKSTFDAKSFLAATPERRLDLLKPFLAKGEDDKRDIGAIIAFLQSLEKAVASTGHAEGLRPIYRARKYVADKGALIKPLLEQVALLV